MKPVITISFVAAIVFTGLSFTFLSHNPERKHSNMEKGVAVVEWFTSEGCSSCPPADEVMARLDREFEGAVYFLGFHVDYWDYIGWKDTFSKAAYTERQRRYSDVFNLNSIYTPQAVVNGKTELVGSKENQLRSAIQQALKDSAASGIRLQARKNDETNIIVSYTVSNAGGSDLYIALVQSEAITNVKRGENRNRKLAHINIVRELKAIAVNRNANGVADFKIPQGLTSKDIKLIAFMQDRKSLHITGAAKAVVD